MTQEITQRIDKIKAKMAKLDPNSQMYQAYSNTLREAQGALPKAPIRLHVDTGPTCEGCQ